LENTLDDLLTNILPALFAKPDAIGQYGHAEASPTEGASEQLTASLSGSPVTLLAAGIAAIVEKLQAVDPRRVLTPATWLERFTGRDIETRVRYDHARRELDQLLQVTERTAQRVRQFIASVGLLAEAHDDEQARLQLHIRAGQRYLEGNPAIGAERAGELELHNTRERFARRLANLSALAMSHEQSVHQLQQARSNAVSLLDRFEEASRVLVPMWRAQACAIAVGLETSPELLADATRCHAALRATLQGSIQQCYQQPVSEGRPT